MLFVQQRWRDIAWKCGVNNDVFTGGLRQTARWRKSFTARLFDGIMEDFGS